MREAQRLSTEPAIPNPFAAEPAVIDVAHNILEEKPEEPTAVEKLEAAKISSLPLDTAIRLRWALRDIRSKRTKFSPVAPDDLKTLIEMGLIEMRDDVPVLTNEGHGAI